MNKKMLISIMCVIVVFLLGVLFFKSKDFSIDDTINNIEVTVLNKENNKLTVQDKNKTIYTFNYSDINESIGSNITLNYKGTLNKDLEIQKAIIVSYEVSAMSNDEIPSEWLDDGIFSQYYIQAYDKLKTLTLDEKIAQIFLVRYPENAAEVQDKYQFGGFVFFGKDFKDKTTEEVQNMIKEVQDKSKIPLLTAVDEEGGTVVRVSGNKFLREEKFLSPSELYEEGGFEKIREDTLEKSNLLYKLGLNLNLAPVVDVATNEDDYMYERTLKKDTELTSTYAKTVIEASKENKVSYTLKHFPGYGNNLDTHSGTSVDERSLESITKNDLPPFKEGIKAGAEAIMISHNIVNAIDKETPASLSASVHNLLKNNMEFTGIIISDDISMGALSDIEDKTVKAVIAGNDLIITTNYEEDFNTIKTAVKNEVINENLIDKLAFKVLAWKYYKGLLYENQK